MSARRQARAGTSLLAPVAAGDPPRELRDPDSKVWHDRAAHVRFMAERGWTLSARDRLCIPAGPGAHPANRHRTAASEWAEQNGITNGNHADLHKLRDMGLLPEPSKQERNSRRG